MSEARPTIVGVVGGSSPPEGPSRPWEQVTKLAREVGRAVAKRRAVLLTGGSPEKKSSKVHENAMRGAVDADGFAIGILPKTGHSRLQLKKPLLLVETNLNSHQRNFINGRTPDVLIALEGGCGTLSELLIALESGRPVVFLKSLEVLKCQNNQNKEELFTILQRAYDAADLGGTAKSAFKRELAGDESESAADAVAAALAAAGTPNEGETCYPDGVLDAPRKEDFEEMFKELTESAVVR